MDYRPWGKVDWALSLSAVNEWDFVGVLGTEERSLCSYRSLDSLGATSGNRFIQILAGEPNKYDDASRIAFDKRMTELTALGVSSNNIMRVSLMDPLYKIQSLADELGRTGSSLIIDFTSMPKRFLFPILKSLMLNSDVKNIIATYAAPQNYTVDALYEDTGGWTNLPGFGFGGGEVTKENLVVSVGFLVESLGGHLAKNPNLGELKMLIPFPGPLNALKRTQRSISKIERDQDENRIEKYYVDSLDMSAAFNQIVSISQDSANPISFAPFGPKPISVAMCLYSIKNDCNVYYQQPTIYHPDYSLGIKDNCSKSATNAYWLKYDGQSIY